MILRTWPEGREEQALLFEVAYEPAENLDLLGGSAAAKLFQYTGEAEHTGTHVTDDELTYKSYTIWTFEADIGEPFSNVGSSRVRFFVSTELDVVKVLNEMKHFPDLFNQFPQDTDEPGRRDL